MRNASVTQPSGARVGGRELAVFVPSAKKKLLGENTLGSSVYSTPVVSDNTLYIFTRGHLVGIGPM